MNSRSRSPRRLLILAAACLTLAAAFLAGQYWERFRNGRWYQVHDDQSYSADFGTVHLRHVTDTQGWPFLDPGDSLISFQGNLGSEVTLYQSKRVFQESWPWVDRVQRDGDQLQWSDGVYQYWLRIERVGPATQPK